MPTVAEDLKRLQEEAFREGHEEFSRLSPKDRKVNYKTAPVISELVKTRANEYGLEFALAKKAGLIKILYNNGRNFESTVYNMKGFPVEDWDKHK